MKSATLTEKRIQIQDVGNNPINLGEVRQVLANLKLNSPDYSVLANEPEVLAEAINQQKQNPEVSPGNLIYRIISQKIHTCCGSNLEEVQNRSYQWLGEYVYRLLINKVRQNVAIATDLTNITLEKIFLKYDTCQSGHHFLRWVAQIAINEFLQHRRKQEKRLNPDDIHPILVRLQEKLGGENLPDPLEKAEAKEDSNPEIQIISRERIRQIIERIEQIKPTKRGKYYKDILYGTFFGGLNDAELASVLGLPEVEVQKMRSHVLKLLRSDRVWIDTIR